MPSINKQKAIATFLDRKTAAIDTLIAKKQRLIQLLEEKRAALINQAVTKGLNPDVPMKDSGITWIGEIPEHWGIWSVRNLIRTQNLEIQDGNHGELHPVADDYVDVGIPFIMANDVRNGKINLNSCRFISKQQASSPRIGFSLPGDILFTHKGTVGEIAIVPSSLSHQFIMLTPQVTYYRCKNKKINANYLALFLNSDALQEQISIIASHQSTRAYVGIMAQREFQVVIPPVEEQEVIVINLKAKSSLIYESIQKIKEQIIKFQEYRQSLITAAVTGKLEVGKRQKAEGRKGRN